MDFFSKITPKWSFDGLSTMDDALTAFAVKNQRLWERRNTATDAYAKETATTKAMEHGNSWKLYVQVAERHYGMEGTAPLAVWDKVAFVLSGVDETIRESDAQELWKAVDSFKKGRKAKNSDKYYGAGEFGSLRDYLRFRDLVASFLPVIEHHLRTGGIK